MKSYRLPPSLSHFSPSYRVPRVMQAWTTERIPPRVPIYQSSTHTHTHTRTRTRTHMQMTHVSRKLGPQTLCPPDTNDILCTSLLSVLLHPSWDLIVIDCFQRSRTWITGSSFSLQEVHFPFKLPPGTRKDTKKVLNAANHDRA